MAALLIVAGCGGREAEPDPTGFVVVEVRETDGDRVWLERWPLEASGQGNRPDWRSLPYDEGPSTARGGRLVTRQGDDLLEIGLGDGAARALTPLAQSEAALSPDGLLVAFDTNTGSCEPADRVSPIRVLSVERPRRRLGETPPLTSTGLVSGHWPAAWAPDSSSLAYVVARWEPECRGPGVVYDLFVLDLRTGGTRELEHGTFVGDLQFAPDGSRLAYVTLDGTVRVADLHGTARPVEFADTQDFDGDYSSRVAWTPDGGTLLVSQHGAVSAYDVATEAVRSLGDVSTPDSDGSVAEILGVSSDSRLVAFGREFGRGPIVVTELAGGRTWTFPLPLVGPGREVHKAFVFFD